MKQIFPVAALAFTISAFAADPSDNCFRKLDAQTQLEPLRASVALSSTRNQTIDMMTSTRFPTATEKELVKLWVAERDRCYALGESWRLANMPLSMRRLLDLYYAKGKLLAADLYAAQITYGEFATRRATLSAELNTELNDAWRESNSEHAGYAQKKAESDKLLVAGTAAMHAEAARVMHGGAPLGQSLTEGGLSQGESSAAPE